MIDLDALLSRLADVVADRLRPIVADAVKAAVATKAEPRIYFGPELGKRLGKTPDAFRMYLKRGGYELAALAIDIGGRQAWRADDVEAYLSRKPKLRAIAGGAR